MTYGVDNEPNVARRVAAATFAETLWRFQGKDRVNERTLADAWCTALAEHKEVSVNGWYDPPPGGLAVLAGLPRISFSTLRDERNWPGTQIIDWNEGALYAYCSVVNIADGMPGDFAITLYFGSDPAVRAHFLAAYRATQEVLTAARAATSSRSLFRRSTEIFTAAGLRNCVISYTDTTPLDLGHTFPVPSSPVIGPGRKLTPAGFDAIRKARRFINDDSDWDLRTCGQFTVEPQLVSSGDPGLPQVTFHYVVDPASGRLLDEPQELLTAFGLGA